MPQDNAVAVSNGASASNSEPKFDPKDVIVQNGYATGDVFSVATALVINPDLKVIISKTYTVDDDTKEIKPDPRDRAEMLRDFYKVSLKNSGITDQEIEQRVKLVESEKDANKTTVDDTIEQWWWQRVRVVGMEEQIKQQIKDEKENKEREKFKVQNPNADSNRIEKYITSKKIEVTSKNISEWIKDHHKKSVSYATEYVADNWQKDKISSLKQAWDVNSNDDDGIKEWLEKRKIPTNNKDVVILWSRFSGKKGDIHVEHDTSFEGMRQMIAMAKKLGLTVIIAGGKPVTDHLPEEEKEKRLKKFSELADNENVFDITGFWESEDWKSVFNREETEEDKTRGRMDQFKVYDYLNRYHHLQHLGFRSGNLEAFALMGQTVSYMEEPESEGGERMATWEKNEDIPYNRLIVEDSPTRTGKYAKEGLELVAKIGKVNKELDDKKKETSLKNSEIAKLTERIKRLLSDLRKKKLENEEKLSTKRNELKSLEEKKEETQSLIKEIDKINKTIEGLNGAIEKQQVAEKELNTKHNELKNLEREEKEKEKEKKPLTEKLLHLITGTSLSIEQLGDFKRPPYVPKKRGISGTTKPEQIKTDYEKGLSVLSLWRVLNRLNTNIEHPKEELVESFMEFVKEDFEFENADNGEGSSQLQELKQKLEEVNDFRADDGSENALFWRYLKLRWGEYYDKFRKKKKKKVSEEYWGQSIGVLGSE